MGINKNDNNMSKDQKNNGFSFSKVTIWTADDKGNRVETSKELSTLYAGFLTSEQGKTAHNTAASNMLTDAVKEHESKKESLLSTKKSR